MNVTHTPVFAVAASSTFIRLYTIQGWRPTSLTTQPASIVTTEATPATVAMRRNHRLRGMRRRNAQLAPYHIDNSSSSVPSPTIMSQARCTVLTSESVGWSAGSGM